MDTALTFEGMKSSATHKWVPSTSPCTTYFMRIWCDVSFSANQSIGSSDFFLCIQKQLCCLYVSKICQTVGSHQAPHCKILFWKLFFRQKTVIPSQSLFAASSVSLVSTHVLWFKSLLCKKHFISLCFFVDFFVLRFQPFLVEITLIYYLTVFPSWMNELLC